MPPMQRVQRIEASMLALLETWRLKPAVQALMAFRGFQLVAAMITVSELGDIHRFAHPRQLMTYLGLVQHRITPAAPASAWAASPAAATAISAGC